MKQTLKWIKIILTGICAVVIACCIGVLIYRLAVWQENKACYARLATDYSTSPSYSTIGNALVDSITNKTEPNATRLEVLSVMSEVAPVVEYDIITLSNGELKQRLFLNTCKFVENGFDFMLLFSADGSVRALTLYLDD